MSWKYFVFLLGIAFMLGVQTVLRAFVPALAILTMVGGTIYVTVCSRRFGDDFPKRLWQALAVVALIAAAILLRTGFGLLPPFLLAGLAVLLVLLFLRTGTGIVSQIIIVIVAYLGIITLVWATPYGYREVPWGFWAWVALVLWIWLILFFHFEARPDTQGPALNGVPSPPVPDKKRTAFERRLSDFVRVTGLGLFPSQDNRYVKIWAFYAGCAFVGAMLYGLPTLNGGRDWSAAGEINKIKTALIKADAEAYKRAHNQYPTWAPQLKGVPPPGDESADLSGKKGWSEFVFAITITPVGKERPLYVRGWLPIVIFLFCIPGFIFSMIVGFSDEVFDHSIGLIRGFFRRRRGTAHAAPHDAGGHGADHAPAAAEGAGEAGERPATAVNPSLLSRLGIELTAEAITEAAVELLYGLRRHYKRINNP